MDICQINFEDSCECDVLHQIVDEKVHQNGNVEMAWNINSYRNRIFVRHSLSAKSNKSLLRLRKYHKKSIPMYEWYGIQYSVSPRSEKKYLDVNKMQSFIILCVSFPFPWCILTTQYDLQGQEDSRKTQTQSFAKRNGLEKAAQQPKIAIRNAN